MDARALVADGDEGQRLDVFLAKLTGSSRSQAGSLIDDGYVTVNAQVQRKAYKVAAGDVVEVRSRPAVVLPPPADVDVVFEDDDLMVVSKPAGVVVHAAPGLRESTLVDALTAQGRPLAPRAGAGRAGIVHRLDRDVSGLLIVAKTDTAHSRLVDAMKRRAIERRYIALVNGVLPTDSGKIDAPVGRDPKHRTRMAVSPGGRPAVTWFTVKARLGDCALLDVRLETGRTHQIRTHLASIGHPVVGDAAYGRDPALAKRIGLRRPFLHAARLSFDHPTSGERLEFESPLPDDLAAALEKAGAP
jgi:23S rRNA pseudouridine1911/1915/1917 synthase